MWDMSECVVCVCLFVCVCVLRDAVVGALMPACMMIPMECPSSPPAPLSDSSSSSSPSEAEGPPLPAEAEERVSPNPWQDRKGEVRTKPSQTRAHPAVTRSQDTPP